MTRDLEITLIKKIIDENTSKQKRFDYLQKMGYNIELRREPKFMLLKLFTIKEKEYILIARSGNSPYQFCVELKTKNNE